MITIISPAKSQNFDVSNLTLPSATQPEFLNRTEVLAGVMKDYSVDDLESLMDISESLAELNYDRFQKWTSSYDDVVKVGVDLPFKEAITAFTGTVYQQFDLEKYNTMDLDYLQDHVRIISGFYGVLRPLDQIRPYRLEMGRKISVDEHKNLYSFWKEDVAVYFDEIAVTDGPILNLASQEYAKALDRKICEAEIIDVDFKVMVSGKIVSRGFLAKQARGAMADLIVRERINDVDGVKKLRPCAFKYNENRSTDTKLVFVLKK